MLWIAETLAKAGGAIGAVGHRIVHGGLRFAGPALIDAEVIAALTALIPLARLHQPINLAAVEAVARRWPGLPQVACFDTAFHRSQSRLARLFPIPRAYADEGVLRYGFHGLSYEHIASQLPELLPDRARGRVIVAHLGNGASLCAMADLQSRATTMGLTALDGLMMGSRSGSVDPGLILYLIRERGMSAEAVEEMLTKRSGLLGVSGISADVRMLEASDDPAAKDALDLFAWRCAREVGSLIPVLGGLDAFVFTGGIGEHSAPMRKRIADLLAWTGLRIDDALNEAASGRIGASGASVETLIVPANEELTIARATRDLAFAPG